MPTKRPRKVEYAENLPANLKTEDVCPSVWTGQQLFDKRPKDYAKVVQMLAQGATIKQTCKACKVSPHTVAIVRSRESETLKDSKKHLRGLIGTATHLAVESLITKLQDDEIPSGVLPIATGILIDKHRQYEGEPTQVIEVKKSLSLDEIRAELANLKDEKIIEAEVTDAEPSA
tara:strand:- start:76 stop:597 length:522 start_codon:yes stop_codon:yes gene_type:complete